MLRKNFIRQRYLTLNWKRKRDIEKIPNNRYRNRPSNKICFIRLAPG